MILYKGFIYKSDASQESATSLPWKTLAFNFDPYTWQSIYTQHAYIIKTVCGCIDLYLYVIQAIESTNRLVVDDCFTEMLSHWIKRSTPPSTWTELRDALKSPAIGREDIAGKIKK